jgi:hypothetical protein
MNESGNRYIMPARRTEYSIAYTDISYLIFMSIFLQKTIGAGPRQGLLGIFSVVAADHLGRLPGRLKLRERTRKHDDDLRTL